VVERSNPALKKEEAMPYKTGPSSTSPEVEGQIPAVTRQIQGPLLSISSSW